MPKLTSKSSDEELWANYSDDRKREIVEGLTVTRRKLRQAQAAVESWEDAKEDWLDRVRRELAFDEAQPIPCDTECLGDPWWAGR